MYEHRNHTVPGFIAKYRTDRLVYFEEHNDANTAISREKQIKGWLRRKKIALIESMNPDWRELASDWFPQGSGE